MKSTLVVLSGGMDSAVCMAWAHDQFKNVEAITFDYGQRHIREIESAKNIADLFGVRHDVIKLDALSSNAISSLTNKDKSVDATNQDTGLPSSFLPGRNLIFLTVAASLAISRGMNSIVTGVCQADYNGYPDCRSTTIGALENAIYLGNEPYLRDAGFKIYTPVICKPKAETITMAMGLDRGMQAIGLSWSCYNGGEKPCGHCPACTAREMGFSQLGLKDPAQ